MRITIVVCFLFVAALFLSRAGAQGAPDKPLNLRKMPIDDLGPLETSIAQQNKELVSQINSILESAKESDRNDVRLIYLCQEILEQLPGPHCIGTLLRRIEFYDEPTGAATRRPLYPYVAIAASMGMPAVREIRPLLDTEADSFRVALMAEVLRGAMGTNPAIAQVQDWLDELDPPSRNSREGKSMVYMIERLKSKEPIETLDPRLKQAKH